MKVDDSGGTTILEAVRWLETTTSRKLDYNREKLVIPCTEEGSPPVSVEVALRCDLEDLTYKFEVRTKYNGHQGLDGDPHDAVLNQIEHLLWSTSVTGLLGVIQSPTWTREEYEEYEKELTEALRQEKTKGE